MDDHEFGDIIRTACGLWPKHFEGLTDEQRNVWRTVCIAHPFGVVQSLLRDWATNRAISPKPIDIKNALRERSERDRKKNDPPIGWIAILRAKLVAESKDPDQARRISEAPDVEIEIYAEQSSFIGSARAFGPASGTTVHYYLRQCRLENISGRRVNAVPTTVVDKESIAYYVSEGGMDDADRIYEARIRGEDGERFDRPSRDKRIDGYIRTLLSQVK